MKPGVAVWRNVGSWFMINGSWAKYGSWFKVNGSCLIVLLIGCSISITIEALQFCFMKGFSELDDVMHNTVGCLMGWLMVKGSRLMMKNNLRYEQDEDRG